LSWTASSRATHDDIHHLTASDSEWNTPMNTGIASTAFSEPGPSNGTKYSYQVTAIHSAGRSGASRELSARISIVETSMLPDDDSGNDNSRDLTAYFSVVFRSGR
jgi:hypothetical protein